MNICFFEIQVFPKLISTEHWYKWTLNTDISDQ